MALWTINSLVSYRGPKTDETIPETKVVEDNGLNPEWNESFNYTMKLAELSFIKIAVIDEYFGKDDLGKF